jgi:hypothetical protein
VILRTIEVWRDKVPFDRLPADISAALRPAEAAAYRAGPAYFAGRAAGCRSRPLGRFLRRLAAAPGMRLHLYGGAEPEFRAYFGFRLRPGGRYVQVRLGPAELPGDPPAWLAEVYREIDGTMDGDERNDGWRSAEYVQSVTDYRWGPTDPGGFDPDVSYPVYGFGNGDAAGYAGPRRAFLYEHEDGGRLTGFDLRGLATEYFGDYDRFFGG